MTPIGINKQTNRRKYTNIFGVDLQLASIDFQKYGTYSYMQVEYTAKARQSDIVNYIIIERLTALGKIHFRRKTVRANGMKMYYNLCSSYINKLFVNLLNDHK